MFRPWPVEQTVNGFVLKDELYHKKVKKTGFDGGYLKRGEEGVRRPTKYRDVWLRFPKLYEKKKRQIIDKWLS